MVILDKKENVRFFFAWRKKKKETMLNITAHILAHEPRLPSTYENIFFVTLVVAIVDIA